MTKRISEEHVTTADVMNGRDVGETRAQQILRKLRKKFKKEKLEPVVVDEYSSHFVMSREEALKSFKRVKLPD